MLKKSKNIASMSRLNNAEISLIYVCILSILIIIVKGAALIVILPPFNFQTLTTFVYQNMADGQIGLVSLFTLSSVGFVALLRVALTMVHNILQLMRISEEAV